MTSREPRFPVSISDGPNGGTLSFAGQNPRGRDIQNAGNSAHRLETWNRNASLRARNGHHPHAYKAREVFLRKTFSETRLPKSRANSCRIHIRETSLLKYRCQPMVLDFANILIAPGHAPRLCHD